MTEKPVECSCQACARKTLHDVVFSDSVEGGHEYHESSDYQIVRCRGCRTTSFRVVYHEWQLSYSTGPEDDDWDHPQTITTYPPALENHKPLAGLSHLPNAVRTVYSETVTALAHGATILGGVGLRATLEAVCNAESITGKDLAERIDALGESGMISAGDAARLHAIRFIGNDAAHELKPVDTASISIALKIVEHLLESAYILDSEAEGTLEPTFSTHADLIEQIKLALPAHPKGAELPLRLILGKASRRFRRNLRSMEPDLQKEIRSGAFTLLAIGKRDAHPQTDGKHQHYIIL